MQKWILAVSPDNGFLEQVSAHLQEGGRFLVVCASSGKEALTAAGSQPFDLAILDAEIGDLPFVPLTRELTALIPNLRMLVYPPNNNPKHPALNGLIANGFLNKPFFGPEVISKITGIFKEIPPEQMADQQVEKTLPELWLEDPNFGLQQIEQLVGATSATAGLLLLRGQVIAATGVLSNESTGNIVNFLTRYWTNIQSGELFRYLKMNYETVTYLVYAVPLFKNVAVGLVYHPGASLEEVREEVTNLRKGFLNRYTNTGELRRDFGVKETPFENRSIDAGANRPPQRVKTRPIPPDTHENLNEVEAEEPLALSENELNNLDALIADMPSPDPEGARPSTRPLSEPEETIASQPYPAAATEVSAPEEPESLQPADTEPLLEPPGEEVQPQPSEQQADETTAPAKKTAPLPSLPQVEHPEENYPDFNFKLPWEMEEKHDTPAEAASAIPMPPPLPISENVPPPLAKEEAQTPPELPLTESLPPWFNEFVSQEPQEESISPSDLLFRHNIVLLPRNAEQFITRDLSEVLNQILPQIHKANNWDFISISIRPQYLIWSTAFPLSVSITTVANEVRKMTNEKLFMQFPHLLSSLPSADFWANGYFAISGANSPSNRLIQDFMELSHQVTLRLTNF